MPPALLDSYAAIDEGAGLVVMVDEIATCSYCGRYGAYGVCAGCGASVTPDTDWDESDDEPDEAESTEGVGTILIGLSLAACVALVAYFGPGLVDRWHAEVQAAREAAVWPIPAPTQKEYWIDGVWKACCDGRTDNWWVQHDGGWPAQFIAAPDGDTLVCVDSLRACRRAKGTGGGGGAIWLKTNNQEH